MADFDDVLASAKPRTARVQLCLRGDLLADHQVLQAELQDHAGDEDELAAVEIAQAIKALEADIADARTEFVFQSLRRKEWTDLLADHPPTEEQTSLGMDFNADTFPSAAIAASCVEPAGVTVEKLNQLEEVIGFGEWQALWATCLSVNTRDRSGESAAASAVLQRWRLKSEQPSSSAPPDPSSSDG